VFFYKSISVFTDMISC